MNVKSAKIMQKLIGKACRVELKLQHILENMCDGNPRREAPETESAVEKAMVHVQKARGHMLDAMAGYKVDG